MQVFFILLEIFKQGYTFVCYPLDINTYWNIAVLMTLFFYVLTLYVYKKSIQ